MSENDPSEEAPMARATATVEVVPELPDADILGQAARQMYLQMQGCAGDRRSYIGVLMHTALFINVLSKQPVAQPLADLALALADLEEGRVTPFLKPKSTGGNRSKNSRVWISRAYAALALECWRRSGRFKDLDSAAKALAAVNVTREAGISWRQLKSWRDEFRRLTVWHSSDLCKAGTIRIRTRRRGKLGHSGVGSGSLFNFIQGAINSVDHYANFLVTPK